MKQNIHSVESLKSQSSTSQKPRSIKTQLAWMIGLWLGGVIALYLFVKIAKAIMSAVGLGS